MEANAARAHAGSALPYWLVWSALSILTGVTFAVSRVDMGWANLPVALLFAIVKASLVLVFFMHLGKETGAAQLTIPVAVLLVLLLAALGISDVRTRFPPSVAGESPVLPATWDPARATPAPPPLTPTRRDLLAPRKEDH